MVDKRTLIIAYFRIKSAIRRELIRLWLRIPFVKWHWINDAKWLLEDATNDPEFAAWYAVELYNTHMDNEYWTYYESGSAIAQEDMSYWSD